MRRWVRFGALLLVLLGTTSVGLAQSERATSEGSGATLEYSERVDLEEFEAPPPGSAAARVSAPLMVTLAYAAIWLLAAGFMWSIWRRGRGLEGELRAAERRLEALDERLRVELSDGSEGEG